MSRTSIITIAGTSELACGSGRRSLCPLVWDVADNDSTEFNELTQICLVPPQYLFVSVSGLGEL